MKAPSIALLALVPVWAAAVEPPSLAFPEQRIGLPPLKLAQIGRQALPDALSDPGLLVRPPVALAVASKKFVSHMPIIMPKDHVDSKMVKVPDSSIDYKLIVKAPDVESSR
jgi:hypothetical protein